MSSTFFGISLAASGLEAQRRAMDIVGYNIAHANDPTYHRQRVVLTESAVLAQGQESSVLGTSPFGNGVQAGEVQRIRDGLIENRMQLATQQTAEWGYRSQTLGQIESMLGEPSGTGLQNDLDQFWNAWQGVATDPTSLPARNAVLQKATGLAQSIQYQYSQMQGVVTDLNYAIGDRVNQINSLGQELADLNHQIASLEPGQIQVNDLENRRDAVVQELSKTATVAQSGSGEAGYVVSIGGRVLVQGDKFNALKTDTLVGGNVVAVWASDGEALNNLGGELRAIADLKDTIIPGYMSQLDTIANGLISQVNAVHQSGFALDKSAGIEFFLGTGAADIHVNADLDGRPDLVAASSNGDVGDNKTARQINQLQGTKLADGLTIDDHYRKLVGDIGGSSANAQSQSHAQELTLNQLSTQQQSVSGVSLDEEMTNMIKFQQAYNASARVLTAFDQMLTTLIENTGSAGR